MKKIFLILILALSLAGKASAQEINAGDTAWVSAASALVMLMSAFMSIRVSREEEEKGLDYSQHGEEAYN